MPVSLSSDPLPPDEGTGEVSHQSDPITTVADDVTNESTGDVEPVEATTYVADDVENASTGENETRESETFEVKELVPERAETKRATPKARKRS